MAFIVIVIILLSGITNAIFGLFVYLKAPKTASNKWFVILAISSMLVCLTNIILRLTGNADIVYWTYAIGIFATCHALIWILYSSDTLLGVCHVNLPDEAFRLSAPEMIDQDVPLLEEKRI